MYQLNKDYRYDADVTLKNPKWKLAPVLDDGENMQAIIYLWLWTTDAYRFKIEVHYDYTAAGTWQDQDLYDYVKLLPEFEGSTLIEE